MMNLVLLIYKIQSDFAYDLTLFLHTIKGKHVQRILLSKKRTNCTLKLMRTVFMSGLGIHFWKQRLPNTLGHQIALETYFIQP